jgi:hypothetical protein
MLNNNVTVFQKYSSSLQFDSTGAINTKFVKR